MLVFWKIYLLVAGIAKMSDKKGRDFSVLIKANDNSFFQKTHNVDCKLNKCELIFLFRC